jgi:hypothetical protein
VVARDMRNNPEVPPNGILIRKAIFAMPPQQFGGASLWSTRADRRVAGDAGWNCILLA